MDLTLYIDESNKENVNYDFLLSTGIFTVVNAVPKDKFFYPVFLIPRPPFIANIQIPKGVLDCIDKGMCAVLVIHYTEAWHYYKKILSQLQEDNNLHNDKIVLITNDWSTTNYKCITLNSWEPLSYSQNFIQEKIAGQKAVLESNLRPYKFICLNRVCHPHRFAVVSALYQHKDEGLLSFANSEYTVSSPGHYRNKSFNSFLSTYKECGQRWLSLNLTKDLILKLPDTVDDLFSVNHLMVVDPDTEKFYKSYLHIVTETHIGHVFFSEKTFKPIKYFQPFISINGPHSLTYLRKLGYKTFAGYIDESYDDIKDNEKRIIKAIQAGMDFVNQKDLDSIIKKMYPILEHNYNNFLNRCRNFQNRLHEDISKISFQ